MRFASKADWAEAKAREFDEAAARISAEHVEYKHVRKKMDAIAANRAQANRFRSMAATFRRSRV